MKLQETQHDNSALKSLICTTMPTAGVASGFISRVDTTSAVVASLMAKHGERLIREHHYHDFSFGTTSLRNYMATIGESLPEIVLTAFRSALLDAALRYAVELVNRSRRAAEAMAELEAMRDTRNTEIVDSSDLDALVEASRK